MSDYYEIKDRLSNSVFKNFMDCSARAYAELIGEIVKEQTPALEIGKYIDAMVFNEPEPTLSAMLFKKDGSLYKQYEYLNTIISEIKADAKFMSYLIGETQTEIMFEWEGIPWKAKIDCIPEGYCNTVVDLKTTADIEKWEYSKRFAGRVPFYYAYGYDIQGAVYRQATGLDRFIMAIGTKESPCGRHLIEIPQEQLNCTRDYILDNQEKIWDNMNGKGIEYCDNPKCAYCRSKKETILIMADTFSEKKAEVGF